MQTTQNTETYKISLTEIIPDSDDTSIYEISFIATLTPSYLRSTPYFIDAIKNYPTDIETFYDDIDDFGDTDDYITYEFNVASRHSNGLYFIIQHDRNGDYYDNSESIIFAFGTPIYEFIAATCKLLKIPFCTTE